MSELTEKQENLHRKIRGLLRKAEATNYNAEAQAFVKKAQELMYAHAIDEETLWASEPDSRPKPVIEKVTIKHNSTGAYYYRVLLNACAKYNRCKMWYNNSTCSICGFDSDITYVMMLYASIVSDMNMQMAIGLAHSKEHPKTYKVNFMQSFSYEIYDRLRNTQKEIHTASHKVHSKALVLSRDHQIEQFMREMGIKVGKARSHQTNFRISEGARAAGERAAQKTDISGGRDRIATRRSIGG